MPATKTDFTTTLKEQGDTIAAQWPALVRAVQSLALYFSSKIAEGTEPNDVLTGVMLGLSGQSTTTKDWRIRATATNEVVFEENTGSEATPTWTERFKIGPSGVTVTAHASTHASGGADPVDHDTLTNFVASKHVDHTTVNITAGTGLSGGGDISASRTLNLDSSTLTDKPTPVATDELILRDAGGMKKADAASFSSAFDHDLLTNFVPEEHIRWDQTGAEDIHDDRLAPTVVRTNVNQEFTKAQGATESTPAISAGALTLDFDASNYFEVSLTENITSITINNLTRPGTRVLKFTQDATGGRTVSGWPAAVKWPGGTAPTISSAANAVDVLTFLVDSAGTIFGVFTQDLF